MSTEQLTECPVCGNHGFSHWLTCKDFLVSEQEFTIQACQKCGFKVTSPRPAPQEIGQYYQSEQYISHSDTREGLVSRLYHSVRNITVRQKVSLIGKLVPTPGRLLDIGCGSGYFLQEAAREGWSIHGVEPDQSARRQAEERTKMPIVPSIDQLELIQPVDVITMWHVLEHVHSLSETLEWMRAHTVQKGYAVIAVPNHLSWDAEQYRQYWAAYDVPRHLYHFTPAHMESLLQRYGYRPAGRRPMWFDAFYVNLLSTKNRDGKPAYLESFWNGFRSNWAAQRNGGNYSSLIYIAQAH
ncbi:class I SAM-dependent methyltransferase [Larkinella soli]|uniref:class I SAM-dependent methyltransferase n=1 Tax=Larkinella soli TaxID=1770527 RepID=UPI000FFBDFFC|nr:class I SAM-dependent methyltransferase [Larkinella soli]